jgi:hypothetical protein
MALTTVSVGKGTRMPYREMQSHHAANSGYIPCRGGVFTLCVPRIRRWRDCKVCCRWIWDRIGVHACLDARPAVMTSCTAHGLLVGSCIGLAVGVGICFGHRTWTDSPRGRVECDNAQASVLGPSVVHGFHILTWTRSEGKISEGK